MSSSTLPDNGYGSPVPPPIGRRLFDRPRLVARGVNAVAGVLSVVMLATLSGAVPTLPQERSVAPKATPIPKVDVRKVAPVTLPKDTTKQASSRPDPVWPTRASARLAVARVGSQPTSARVGGLPVLVGAPDPASEEAGSPSAAVASQGAPERVQVEVLDQAAAQRAGVKGQLVRVGRADGQSGAAAVSLGIGYGGFETRYGGDWANRLRLVALPECALSTPDRAECQGAVLPTRNNATTRQVTATVAVGAAATMAAAGGSTVVAVSAGASGTTGDFSATPLAASSTWSAGGSAGDFSWSYDLRMPPAVNGPAPTAQLGYSSQSVDGMMAASNNQPSVVGVGFELAVGGFIERRYRTCSEDQAGEANNNDKKTGDQCWVTDNAVLNMAGQSTELIRDATDVNRWHPRSEDGSKVERRIGATNGDDNGEWWVVTAPNGTQYWFGRNRLPGWKDKRSETQSTWTAPVYGNHPGEPCFSTVSFAKSSCTQAWRWNLDYVVDPHRNTMSLWYATETNTYAKNADPDAPESYVRAGRLERVDYGTRVEPNLEHGEDNVFTGLPVARVDLAYADRCKSDCTKDNDNHWPDTPIDLECDAKECFTGTPTFWTRKRLATITTQVHDPVTAKMRNVERWTLGQSFPARDDSTRPGLWLDRISHIGMVGADAELPDITFHGVSMDNRVDTSSDQAPAMKWRRMERIETETGAVITVKYHDPDCVPGSRMPDKNALENNTLRCYPVNWTREGYTTPKLDFFHKYVVEAVTETDAAGGTAGTGAATRVVSRYSYLGDPAWHYTDDDGLVSPEFKTWSGWRGYAKVGVTVGDPGEQTYAESLYLRGMDDDKLPKDKRSVTVRDSEGGAVVDHDWYAGMLREQRTFNGPGGAEVSGVIYDPWASEPTATRTVHGVSVAARYVNTQGTRSRTVRDQGRAPMRTSERKTFDGYGMVVKVDNVGDVDVAGDEQCAITTYEPRNTTDWLLASPHRAQSFARTCADVAKGGMTDADALGDVLTSYDEHAHGASPTLGDATLVRQLSGWKNRKPEYLAVSRSAYDRHGRVTDSWDAMEHHTGTAYTPATGGPVTQVVTTNPRNWTSTSILEPAWGAATATIDVNGLRTDLTYDGLGRLTAGWSPERKKDVHSATVRYEYLIRKNGANAVTSQRLNAAGDYVTSYALYDSLLRPRQSQAPSPAGGRVITDTFYDTAGRAMRTFGAYPATGSPGVDLVQASNLVEIPNQTRTVYDGAGRVSQSIFEPRGKEWWKTVTYYGGDHTDVTPPAGGTATSTIVDGRGRTVEQRSFRGGTPTGAYDSSWFHYNRKAQLDRVTDSAGNSWEYLYDLRGRKSETRDPDRGSSKIGYDNLSRITSTTNWREEKLLYTYDSLSRPTGTYRDSVTAANQLVGWSYDLATFASPTPATPATPATRVKGLQHSATRYAGSATYSSVVAEYDLAYRATSTSINIPLAEAGLAGNYIFATGYNADGSVNSVTAPGMGDLRTESVGFEYTTLGLPLRMTTFYGIEHSSYVSEASYDALGAPAQYTLYTGLYSKTGSLVYQAFNRELETGRLTNIKTVRDGVSPNTVADVRYTYDNAGKVRKVADAPEGGAADVQCFEYDHQQRLTQAWTPNVDDCAGARDVNQLGGPAKYWMSWEYDPFGRRQTQTEHLTTGDAVSTYGYLKPTAPTKSHVLETVTRTAGTSSVTTGFSYDGGGNTKTRTAPDGSLQTLTWDRAGHLETTQDGAGKTSYVYNSEGGRLLRRDAKGATLYLPGAELRWDRASNSKTCTRFYGFGGSTVAQRNAAGVTWLASDRQGTQQVAIDERTQQATVRRQTPFGTPRGESAPWLNEKGFVGGTADPTGLTHLGAREYDPVIGRFISVDSVMDLSQPAQWDGYSYANNSPVTLSDPSGLAPTGSGGDGCGGPFCNSTEEINAKPTKKTKKSDSNDDSDGDACAGGICNSSQVSSSSDGCGGPVCNRGRLVYIFPNGTTAVVTPDGRMILNGIEVTEWITRVDGMPALDEFADGFDRYVGKHPNNGRLFDSTTGLAQAHMWRDAFLKGYIKTSGNQAVHNLFLSSVHAFDGENFGDGPGLPGGLSLRGRMRAPGARSPGCSNSFDPETRVLMADGTTKAIKDVKVGDRVAATDPESDVDGKERVTHLLSNEDHDLADVTVVDSAGISSTIQTTQEHPFWDVTTGEWTDAVKLRPGDQLSVAYDTNVTRTLMVWVVGVRAFTGAKAMLNLTVDNIHTYYVVAGSTPVLVHNCDWTSRASLDRHYGEHGADLGHYTKGDYDQGAKGLMCGSCRSGIREKDAMIEGKVYRWDPDTNEFGIKDRRTGKIVSYFDITDAHGGAAAYWGRQPGLER